MRLSEHRWAGVDPGNNRRRRVELAISARPDSRVQQSASHPAKKQRPYRPISASFKRQVQQIIDRSDPLVALHIGCHVSRCFLLTTTIAPDAGSKGDTTRDSLPEPLLTGRAKDVASNCYHGRGTIMLATTMHPDKPVAQGAERPVRHLDRPCQRAREIRHVLGCRA